MESAVVHCDDNPAAEQITSFALAPIAQLSADYRGWLVTYQQCMKFAGVKKGAK